MKKFSFPSASAYKSLLHTLLSITPFVVILFLLLKTFNHPGYIKYIDVTDPLNVVKLYQRYIYTYSNDIGEAIAEKQRIPLFYLIFVVFKLTTLGGEWYIKIKMLLLYALSFLTCAIVNYKFIKFAFAQNGSKDNKHILPISLLGAVFYVSSFWFTNRIMHFGLFFSTLTAPITFYLTHSFLYSEKFRPQQMLLLLLLSTIFSATPHSVLFIFVIVTTLLLVYTAFERSSLRDKVAKIGGVIAFFILYIPVNFLWLYPYIKAAPFPDAIPGESIVTSLSVNATLLNTIKLNGYWMSKPPALMGINFISFLPFFITILCVAFNFKKRMISIPLSVLLVTSIFLASFENYNKEFLFWVMFKSPIKSFGWVLREPDKFGLILSYIYAVGMSILAYKILQLKTSKLLYSAYLILVLGIISLNIYFLSDTLNKYYVPQEIPKSFFNVNKILEDDKDIFNVVWYPNVKRPTWSTTDDIRHQFVNMTSSKPTVTTRSDVINYLDFVFNPLYIESVYTAQALNNLGVKYLIVRKDSESTNYIDLERTLDKKVGLQKIYFDNVLVMYKNTHFSGIANAYSNRLLTDKGNGVLWERDLENKLFIDFTDKPSDINNIETYYETGGNNLDILLDNYSNRFIYPFSYAKDKETGKPGHWTFGSLENLTHAEVDFAFLNMGFYIRQFDYGRGFVMAREGFMKANTLVSGKPLNVVFYKHPNVLLRNKTLTYTSLSSDFKYIWNTIRSDIVNVDTTRAIEVKLKSDIQNDLTPHFKLTFYDSGMSEISVIPMYADDRGWLDYIAKVPSSSKFFDFSVWSLSTNKEYNYSVKNLDVEDISDNVRPVELMFKHQNTCEESECVIIARILKNTRGGDVGIEIDNNKFNINTKLDGLANNNDRFEWVTLGTAKNLRKTPTFKFTNYSGFNAINVMALLKPEEYASLNLRMSVSENKRKLGVLPDKPNVQISTQEINPTKYEINVTASNDLQPTVLTFAKPFSKDWTLNGKRASVINGYINGWYMNDLKSGTYIIQHEPQLFFEKGIVISILSFVIVLGAYVAVSVIEVKKSGRISKSQG